MGTSRSPHTLTFLSDDTTVVDGKPFKCIATKPSALYNLPGPVRDCLKSALPDALDYAVEFPEVAVQHMLA